MPEDQILALTLDNTAAHPTGTEAVCVTVVLFGVLFVLTARRDRQERAKQEALKETKQKKWNEFMAGKQMRSFCKLVKIGFQSRHTWFSLLFRKSGTSFQSVDRCFVALLTVCLFLPFVVVSLSRVQRQ